MEAFGCIDQELLALRICCDMAAFVVCGAPLESSVIVPGVSQGVPVWSQEVAGGSGDSPWIPRMVLILMNSKYKSIM